MMAREAGIGGTERQLAETARFLDRRRFLPHVACLRPAGIRAEELRQADIPLVTFPVHSFASAEVLKAILEVRRYIRRNGIQLVHTFDTPMNVFGVAAARIAGTPVILSSQRAYRELSGPAYRRLLRITDRLVNGVVVNCDAIRRHLISDEGVSPNRIHLCYNGIDIAQFPAGTSRNEEIVTAGIVCALRMEKNLETLLEAYAGIRSCGVASRLVIVGSGPMENILRNRIASLGIADSVHMEPATRNVSDWLQKIDVFVLPSTSEAFSNSLMEAMASGCAVIASDVGGNPELISEGTTGLLFPAGNVRALAECMQRLLTKPELRLRLAGNALSRIREEFTIQAAARRMAQIYTEQLVRKFPLSADSLGI